MYKRQDIRAENAIVEIAGGKTIIHINDNCSGTVKFTAAKGQTINICTLKKEQAVNFWKVNIRGCDRVIITQAGVLASEKTMKFECARMESVNFSIFPDAAPRFITGAEVINKSVSYTHLYLSYCQATFFFPFSLQDISCIFSNSLSTLLKQLICLIM